MNILGFEIRRAKAPRTEEGGGWKPLFGVHSRYRATPQPMNMGEITAFSAVFASVATLAGDVSKLRCRVVSRRGLIWEEDSASKETGLLLAPNPYQTRAQFFEAWMHSRLLYGNAYILLQRAKLGGMPTAMHVLDPTLVLPMVSESGSVFYRIAPSRLAGVSEHWSEMDRTIPASEVIHDRVNTFFHPLIGASPISACALSAKVGTEIQANAAGFFQNGAAPGGILTAPAGMSDEDAKEVKRYWREEVPKNPGAIEVIGADLKFQSFAMRGVDAQLIEQLKFSAEDVARAFRIPAHMIGAAPPPAYANVEALTAAYYSQTLQVVLEQIEAALDKGLGLPAHRRVEFDVNQLHRLDSATRFKSHSDAVSGGWMSPNEARARENLPPVEGGDTPYLQQQNYSLAALANRENPEYTP